jgi:hypothetical protein
MPVTRAMARIDSAHVARIVKYMALANDDVEGGDE